MGKREINIAFCVDNNVSQYLCVALYSILKNADENDMITFYLIQNDFSKKYLDLIWKLRKVKDFELVTIDVTAEESILLKRCAVPQKTHYTIATFYKFLIGKIPVDKVIYLDPDILVLGSLNDLYAQTMNDNMLAGVLDLDYFIYLERYKELVHGLYVNTGVLLLDLRKWRQYDMTEQLVDLAEYYKPIADQDIFNLAFEGKIQRIDFKYNYQICQGSNYYDKFRNVYGIEVIKKAENEPIILHYLGASKPGTELSGKKFNRLYKKYLFETILRIRNWDMIKWYMLMKI